MRFDGASKQGFFCLSCFPASQESTTLFGDDFVADTKSNFRVFCVYCIHLPLALK